MTPVVSGRRYVGVTVNFAARRQNHRHEMRHGKHRNPRVQAEYDRCGIPVFRPLVSCLDPDARFDLEALVIEQTQPELNMPRPAREFVVNGVNYTVAHAAKTFGIPEHRLLQRLGAGWSPEQVVGLSPKPQQVKSAATQAAKRARVERHLVEFEGRKVRLSELCKEHGITYFRAKSRIDKGWTFAEVLKWWKGS